MPIENKKSTYPTARQFKEWKAQINTVDIEATEMFNVQKTFGFRFNHNFRWFWAQAITCKHFKTLGKLPLRESQVVCMIHLN
jgi:hypothetical protein